MKRIKIMLTAITVLAVVGGALAFKAKNFGAKVYCTDGTGICNQLLNNSTVVDPGGFPPPATISSTCTDADHSANSCAKRTVYVLQ